MLSVQARAAAEISAHKRGARPRESMPDERATGAPPGMPGEAGRSGDRARQAAPLEGRIAVVTPQGPSIVAVAIALAGAPAGCSKKPPPAPDPAPAPIASAAIHPVISATPPAASPPTPAPDASTADHSAVAARIADFFKQYKEGSDFEFLRARCTSPIERFISFKNADIGVVIKSARQFFQGKYRVGYVPDLKALKTEMQGDVTVAHLPVAMSWGVQPTDDVPKEGDDRAAVDLTRTDLGPLDIGLVEHDVTVDVELAFAPGGLVTRYLELHVRRPLLRVTGETNCTMGDLRKGQTVVDLGDSYVTFMTPKGPQRVHRVQIAGQPAWIDEIRSWEVDNPAGGTSAGGSSCLEPVPAKP